MSSLVAETGWGRGVIEARLSQAVKMASVIRAGELFLHGPALETLKLRIASTAGDFHKNNPLVAGISKDELRSQVDATPEGFEAVAANLALGKKLEVFRYLVRLP